jgi:hypothetical protein
MKGEKGNGQIMKGPDNFFPKSRGIPPSPNCGHDWQA